jgi:hypothetical protein
MTWEHFSSFAGFGAPFAAAGSVVWLFTYIDKNASGPANQALSQWIGGQHYQKSDLTSAVVGAFDALYSYPLFKLKAFIRSLAISTIAFVFVYFIRFQDVISHWQQLGKDIDIIITFLACTVISDYISLFIIRKILCLDYLSIILTLFMAIAMAALIVILIFMAGIATVSIIYLTVSSSVPIRYSLQSHEYYSFIINSMRELLTPRGIWSYRVFYPALLVHLWLVGFALSVALLRVWTGSIRAIVFAQWALEGGNQHPFKAIGFVAGILTFMGGVVVELTR